MRPDKSSVDFWAPRRCLREPVPEIFEAAQLIDQAANAYLVGELDEANDFIRSANMPAIREWIESLWGSAADNPDQPLYHRRRPMDNELAPVAPQERHPVRMPRTSEKAIILERNGWNCAYCGIPLINTKAREILRATLPDALVWGPANRDKHAAFQCMTPEWDHVLPHCHGGTSDVENTVICCGPCNCGKDRRLLEEHGLLDPRDDPRPKTDWDGLTRLIT